MTAFLLYIKNIDNLNIRIDLNISDNTYDIDTLFNEGKASVKARSISAPKTKEYKKMVKRGMLPSKNHDMLMKIDEGVIKSITPEGKYIVECGKSTVLCSSGISYNIGDTVNVFTKDGKKGSIDAGFVHLDLQKSLVDGSEIALKGIENVGKGGFKGYYFNVPVFIPGSLIDLNVCRDFDKFNGADVKVVIISQNNEIDYRTGEETITYTASRKAVLQKQGEKEFTQIMTMPRNTQYTGVITGFGREGNGAFIEFDDYYLNGFSFKFNRGTHKKGDRVKFRISHIDVKKKRITLK